MAHVHDHVPWRLDPDGLKLRGASGQLSVDTLTHITLRDLQGIVYKACTSVHAPYTQNAINGGAWINLYHVLYSPGQAHP